MFFNDTHLDPTQLDFKPDNSACGAISTKVCVQLNKGRVQIYYYAVNTYNVAFFATS